jgi:autotransporter-associated beta strand protein
MAVRCTALAAYHQPGTHLQAGSTSAITTDTGTNLLLEGVISGSGNLLKNGNGTLEVNGAHNTFSGQTTINGGVVQIDDGASLGMGRSCSMAVPCRRSVP